MTKKNIVLLCILFVVVALGLYYKNQPTSTLAGSVSNFAINDTSSIQKINIADTFGNKITLERQEKGLWKLNSTYLAKETSINVLLETISQLKVQSTVSSTMIPNVLRRIAVKHSLVEIFTDDLQSPEKTYYVGHATMNHMGTFMLLETKAEGRSSVPFIVEDMTSRGFLTPRFFTNLDEWRNITLFNHPNLDIKRIEVEFFENPSYSFSLTKSNDNEIKIYDHKLKEIEAVNQNIAKDYLTQFKKVSFEAYAESKLSYLDIDSITNHTPRYEIRVFPENGKNEHITLWKKDVGIEKKDAFGQTTFFDVDRMWGKTHLNSFVFAQYYVFDRLLVPTAYFTQK
ncbi:MAG: hypothetical protein ACJAUV_001410 [Flavobacteriales bacterium]|jgi:hypothetical protein